MWAGALCILSINAAAIPVTLWHFYPDAFTGFFSAVGGFAGASLMYAVQHGIARGIFFNTSGMGSTAITAAAPQTTHTVSQGLVSMTQTFIDTMIVVSCTGLLLVVIGAWQAIDSTGEQTSDLS